MFWQTIPAQYLPLALWMEADRMASLRVDEKMFVAEREVVKEERRMRIENPPFGLLNELISFHAFDVHPYKHPVIGSMNDLNAATIDDVRDFYNTYYVPDNATLLIAGDFETDTVGQPGEPVLRPHPEGAPSRCRATFPRSRCTPRNGASTSSSRGRCRRWWSPTRRPTTAIPIRIRCS